MLLAVVVRRNLYSLKSWGVMGILVKKRVSEFRWIEQDGTD